MHGSKFSINNTQEYWNKFFFDNFQNSIKPSFNQIFTHMSQIELWDIHYQDKLENIINKVEKIILICQEKNDSSLIIQNSKIFVKILSALSPSQFFHIIHYIDKTFPQDNIIIKFIQDCIDNILYKDSIIFTARIKTLNNLGLLKYILLPANHKMVIVDYFLNDK